MDFLSKNLTIIIFSLFFISFFASYLYRTKYRPKQMAKLAGRMGLKYEKFDIRLEKNVDKDFHKEPAIQNICSGIYKAKSVRIYDEWHVGLYGANFIVTIIEMDGKRIIGGSANLLFRRVSANDIEKIVDYYIETGKTTTYEKAVLIKKCAYYFLIIILVIISLSQLLHFI